jgi:hypothetical protein
LEGLLSDLANDGLVQVERRAGSDGDAETVVRLRR